MARMAQIIFAESLRGLAILRFPNRWKKSIDKSRKCAISEILGKRAESPLIGFCAPELGPPW